MESRSKRRWNKAFSIAQLLFIPLALWWMPYGHLPPPGYSVACIAIAAALMSVHDGMKSLQKSLWLVLMAAFLAIELRAISKDRWDNQQVQRIATEKEQQNFANLLNQEKADNKELLSFAGSQFSDIIQKQ
jgi:hypothetical protein